MPAAAAQNLAVKYLYPKALHFLRDPARVLRFTLDPSPVPALYTGISTWQIEIRSPASRWS
jgi:hypothetical protein